MREAWSSVQCFPESDIDFVSFLIKSRPEIIRPHVIVVQEHGKPVTLLAARLEDAYLDIKAGYKALCHIKVRRIVVFYGGLMGRTTSELIEIVVRRLMKSLREERADLLLWPGVSPGTDLRRLLNHVPNPFCRDRVARTVQHWTMNLPASLEELLQKRLNKKQRYYAKRAMQMAEKEFPGQVRYASYSSPEHVEELFENSVKIAKLTYQWGLGVGFRGSQENKDRLVLEARKGWFRGYVMFVKGEPVAFWICTVYNGIVYLDYTGYDPGFRNYEVGTALFLRLIGELSRDNFKLLDFGPGSAFYKEQYGDSSFEEATVCTFSPSVRGMALGAFYSLAQGPMELGRALLKRSGWEQKIKKVWRRSITPAAAEPKQPSQAQVPAVQGKAGEV